MQSGPSRDIDGVDSWRDEVCNKRRATLAVRARGAGAAGQDQVVDELAFSNLIDDVSIDEFFFARHSRLFLLRLQFVLYRAGRASDEGNCDKKTRGHHYERIRRLRAAAAVSALSRDGARAARPECGGHAVRPARPSRGRLRSRVARLALQIRQLAQSFQVSAT